MYVASLQWKNCCFSYLIYSVLASKSNLEARKRNGLFEAFDYATDVEKKKKNRTNARVFPGIRGCCRLSLYTAY